MTSLELSQMINLINIQIFQHYLIIYLLKMINYDKTHK